MSSIPLQSPSMTTPIFGEELELSEKQWRRFTTAELDFILLNIDGEWRYAHVDQNINHSEAQGDVSSLPDSLVWNRLDCDPEDNIFKLLPAFPELPLITKPRNDLKLAKGGTVEFFLGIPTCIEILVSCGGTLTTFATLPSQQLSKTWHGTQLKGDLCYSLNTRASRRLEDSFFPPQDILCHITVFNEGDDTIDIDHIYLPTKNFALFINEKRLWASSARIKIETSDSEKGDLSISTSPGEHAGTTKKLREAADKAYGRVKIFRAFSSFFDTFS